MFIIFVFCSLQLLHIIVVLILELVLVQYNNGWIILHVLVQNSYYYYVLILGLECTIVDTVRCQYEMFWNKKRFISYIILFSAYNLKKEFLLIIIFDLLIVIISHLVMRKCIHIMYGIQSAMISVTVMMLKLYVEC